MNKREKTSEKVNAPATLGTNQSGMRANNEKLVLTILRKEGAMAKAQIAKLTGLSAQTVSVIMRSMEAEGLLIKHDPIRGKVGQPSVPMSINPDGAFFYGLKIGRRSAEMVLINFLGKIIGQEKLFYSYPVASKIIDFAKEAHESLHNLLSPKLAARVSGMGIAMPFSLWSWAQLIGVDEAAMAHWEETDIAAQLQPHFDFPIYLENDATAACGAELVFGDPQNRPANFLYFYVGYFIGGGVLFDNRVYFGPSGNAGALGPMNVADLDGSQVSLIDTSSIATFEHMLHERGVDSEFIWETGNDWSQGEICLQNWLERSANGMAQAIHAAATLIDTEAAVIDGWLPERLYTPLIAEIQRKFDAQNNVGISIPRIQQGTVGKDARVLGAASLPLQAQFMIDIA